MTTSIDPDVAYPGRTVYLKTIVDNGVEPDALIQYSTPDTVAEAREWVKHDLNWFGVKQGFKTTCRISIDNLFEEISTYDPKEAQS